MAESPNKSNLWVFWPVLAVFLIATGYIQLQPQLESPRPAGGAALPEPRKPGDLVRARLWEDPLSAVAQAFASTPAPQPAEQHTSWLRRILDPARTSKPSPEDRRSRSLSASLTKRLGELQAQVGQGGPTRILVLLAMLDGDPYPDEIEWRLRTRLAVLSALGSERFVPEDADHLDVFVLPGSEKDPVYVPFEWFEPQRTTPAAIRSNPHVLLLWLNESQVESGYLACITNLAHQLDQVFTRFGLKGEVRILGPSNSDVLLDMISERSNKPLLGQIVAIIYSSQSTAESARISPKSNEVDGIPIEHIIGTDRDLAKALSVELHLRDACAAQSQNAIAIIAEWDTSYGREMFHVFDDTLPNCKRCNPRTRPEDKGKNLHHFSYLRGIDGRLPGDKAKDQSGTERDKDATTSGWQEPLPGRAGGAVPATGHPRIDYLRRTVDDMKRENIPWKAIGVVGSDVYDKILLIRVLRYYFPGAILFTTDLDASLLDPAEYPSTHNLLIASHFGLALRQELQRDVPPFRSVYQTSLFLATLRAIWDARSSELSQQDRPANLRTISVGPKQSTAEWDGGESPPLIVAPVPVLFEVGRSGPFPLQLLGDDMSEPSISSTVHPAHFARSLWPFRPFQGLKVLWLVLTVGSGLGLLILIVLLASREHKSSDRSPSQEGLRTWFQGIVVVGMVAIPILVVVAVVDHFHPEGEPLRLFEGISTWPSEFLRLIVALFAAGSIVRGLQRLQQQATVDALLGLESQAQDPDRGRKKGIVGWLQVAFLTRLDSRKAYQCLDRTGCRLARVLTLTVCYLVFGLILLLLLGPPDRPIRGLLLNNGADHVLLFLSVAMTVMLLVFVVDATLLCQRFVRWLSRPGLKEWPETKLEEWALTLGFPPRPESHKEPLSGVARTAVEQVLRVKAIAALTRGVGPLIYEPTVALVLMFLSRNRIFDNWDWPAFLIIVFTIGGSAVIACGVSLRMTAAHARHHALKELEAALHQTRRTELAKDDDPSAKAVQAAIEEVKNVKEGAYSSLSENPVIQAILIPLAGLAGLIPLLNRLLGINL
jgi:hypothetical protein